MCGKSVFGMGAAYHVSGYVPPETLVWAEGRPEWQQLQQVEELAKAVNPASTSVAPTDASATGVRQVANAVHSAAAAATAHAAAVKPAGAAKTAVVAAAPVQQDPLAAFKGEISAIEAVSAFSGFGDRGRMKVLSLIYSVLQNKKCQLMGAAGE